MNYIKAIVIFLVSIAKKVIFWSSKIENLKTIKSQLDILSIGLKIFGQQTKWEPFSDVANKAVSLSKTIQSIIDGQEKGKRDVFIKKVNDAKGSLSEVSLAVDSKKGVSVQLGCVEGTYNPIDGSAEAKVIWNK